MKAAHGGQVLVSQAVVDRVRRRLPPAASLRDLGARAPARPRDARARLPARASRRCAADFPRCARSRPRPTTCRSRSTSFIGRERELAEDQGAARQDAPADAARHGRPRQDAAVAADRRRRAGEISRRRVVRRSGADRRSRAGAQRRWRRCSACARSQASTLTQTLCAHVRDRSKLLILLDNCEHLHRRLRRARRRAAARGARTAHRRDQPRGAAHRGEQTYPVLPLKPPDAYGRRRRAAALGGRAAVRRARAAAEAGLHADRARRARAWPQLCARLDGIPLALELAAARMRSLSIHEINARLHDRFKLLTGGSRVALERQQTLRALVELVVRPAAGARADAARPRRACSPGGFDLEAAEAVCGADPLDPTTSSTCWARWSRNRWSWSSRARRVALRAAGDDPRVRARALGEALRLRGTVREWRRSAWSTATTSPPRRGGIATTSSTSRRRRDKTEGVEQGFWMARLERELDNLRAAIALSLTARSTTRHRGEVRGGADALPRCCAATRRRRATTSAPRSRCPRSPSRASRAAHALYVGGRAGDRCSSDHAEARALLTECLAVRRALGDPRDDRRDALDARDAAPAQDRPRRRAGMPGGGDRHLPGDRRHRRRGDRRAEPRRDRDAPGRRREAAGGLLRGGPATSRNASRTRSSRASASASLGDLALSLARDLPDARSASRVRCEICRVGGGPARRSARRNGGSGAPKPRPAAWPAALERTRAGAARDAGVRDERRGARRARGLRTLARRRAGAQPTRHVRFAAADSLARRHDAAPRRRVTDEWSRGLGRHARGAGAPRRSSEVGRKAGRCDCTRPCSRRSPRPRPRRRWRPDAARALTPQRDRSAIRAAAACAPGAAARPTPSRAERARLGDAREGHVERNAHGFSSGCAGLEDVWPLSQR